MPTYIPLQVIPYSCWRSLCVLSFVISVIVVIMHLLQVLVNYILHYWRLRNNSFLI